MMPRSLAAPLSRHVARPQLEKTQLTPGWFLRLLGVMPLNTGNISRTNEKSHLFYCAAESVPPRWLSAEITTCDLRELLFRARGNLLSAHTCAIHRQTFCALKQSYIFIKRGGARREKHFQR
jgi:hypothetical protein